MLRRTAVPAWHPVSPIDFAPPIHCTNIRRPQSSSIMRWLRTISTHPARNQHIGLVSTDGQISRRQRCGPFSARARHRRAALYGRVRIPDAGLGPPVRGRRRDGREGCGPDQAVRRREPVSRLRRPCRLCTTLPLERSPSPASVGDSVMDFGLLECLMTRCVSSRIFSFVALCASRFHDSHRSRTCCLDVFVYACR